MKVSGLQTRAIQFRHAGVCLIDGRSSHGKEGLSRQNIR